MVAKDPFKVPGRPGKPFAKDWSESHIDLTDNPCSLQQSNQFKKKTALCIVCCVLSHKARTRRKCDEFRSSTKEDKRELKLNSGRM